MKRFAINTSIAMIFGLGIGLALVYALRGGSTPIAAAPRAERQIEATNAPADELHVCPSGCTYSSIQDAVDAANDGDVIKVAAGTYTGVQGRTAPPGYEGPSVINQVVYISRTLTIRGGYTTAFADPPDPKANPTTLDAQGQGRVMYITGDISLTVEGLCITGGDAAGLGEDPWGDDAGGGVYVVTATVTIRDSQVLSNTADDGGGLYLDSSDATLSGNTISTNTAHYGAGLYLYHSYATLSGNTISGNAAAGWGWGGGLFLEHSDATLSGNTISANTAADNGGALALMWSSGTFTDNIISTNTAFSGGGLYLGGSDATLSGNTISNNTADYGGGLEMERGDATLSGNTISNNTSKDNGGGLCLEGGTGTLSGNTITSNTAGYHGGGVCDYGTFTFSGNIISGNTAQRYGGGVHSGGTFSGNTISDNTAYGHGGGLYLNLSGTLSGNTVTSNTSYGDGGGIYGGDTLIGNTISDNTAQGDGGGVYVGWRAFVLSGNTVTANTADRGGGLYLYWGSSTLANNVVADNQANTAGSGLYIMRSSPRLLHTTIARNGSAGLTAVASGDGSGVYVTENSTVALTNTILVSHTVGITVTAGNTATLEATLWGSVAWANSINWSGPGTIIHSNDHTGDPAFANPDDGDYHIGPGSAAIDAGVDAGVTTDIDGDPRPVGLGFDIGADEHDYPALEVVKWAYPDPVRPGAPLTYTIRISNVTGVDLHATITDTLPLSVTLDEASGGTLALPGGTLAPPDGTVVLPDGRVAVTWTAVITKHGGVWMGTILVTVDEDAVGSLTNLVEVTTEEGAQGSDSFTVVAIRRIYLPLVMRDF